MGQGRVSELYPKRVAGERFSDFSTFPSHPPSQEMHSGQIPARLSPNEIPISRSTTERESYLPSIRGDFGATNGMSTSYRQERFPPRTSDQYMPERVALFRQSEYREDLDRVSHNVQIPSHGRPREARQPISTSDTNAPMYIERMSRQSEIIVLE
jgi:hypothetical protein